MCQNIILNLFNFDYFHRRTNQLWTENSEMAGLKSLLKLPRKINVSLSLAEKKMNGSCLISQVRSCMLPYASQIALKSFFSDTLFRALFYGSQLSKTKTSCSENIGNVPVQYPCLSAILLKL